MTPRVINLLPDCGCGDFVAAAHALRTGGLVIFPTETVYGIGANAANDAAVARLRAAKGRGGDQPFTVHLGEPADAARFLPDGPALARRLARAFWPGPLTLVCEVADPSRAAVAADLSAAQLSGLFANGRVGLRCPDHAAARRLLSEAGVVVVASSANPGGQSPPDSLQAALDALPEAADYALDGGRTTLRAASTIVEITVGGDWRLLRAGALEKRTIAHAARSLVLFVCTGNSCRSPLAEYLFRHKLAQRLESPIDGLAARGYTVASAGTFAGHGGPASSGTLDELATRGIDAAMHRSQPVTPELLQQAARVFAMTDDHRADILAMAPGVGAKVCLLDPKGAVSDPIGGGPEAYHHCARQIESAVEFRMEEYLDEDRHWQ